MKLDDVIATARPSGKPKPGLYYFLKVMKEMAALASDLEFVAEGKKQIKASIAIGIARIFVALLMLCRAFGIDFRGAVEIYMTAREKGERARGRGTWRSWE